MDWKTQALQRGYMTRTIALDIIGPSTLQMHWQVIGIFAWCLKNNIKIPFGA